MFLESIHLLNYRGHKDLTVEFGEQFTVVAGVNGSGKTSLLMGISAILEHVATGAHYGHGGGWQWQSVPYLQAKPFANGYRFEPQYPVQIEARGDLGHSGKQYVWKCLQNRIGGTVTPSNWSLVSDSPLPLLAFYRASRWWPAEQVATIQAATEKLSRWNAYDQWQHAEISVTALQSWVIAKCLERLQLADETGRRFDAIEDDELAMVNGALHRALPEVAGLRHDMRQKTLVVDWRSERSEGRLSACQPGASDESDKSAITPVSFEHLSDGQRTALCLIADIARRICLLNPQLGPETINETPGLVLIDELDAHLHPKWQRLITNGLKSAFPAVQFIVTSHSPQVLGELKPEEILLLCPEGAKNPQVSYGLDAAQVLDIIMEAPARNEEVRKKIEALFELIEANNLDSARTNLNTLKMEAPGVPELVGAEALIRRKEILGR